MYNFDSSLHFHHLFPNEPMHHVWHIVETLPWPCFFHINHTRKNKKQELMECTYKKSPQSKLFYKKLLPKYMEGIDIINFASCIWMTLKKVQSFGAKFNFHFQNQNQYQSFTFKVHSYVVIMCLSVFTS